MISIFKVFNPLNVLWLAILMFILRIGYIAHVPDKLEFIFVEPFARLLVPVSYEYAFSPTANVFLAGVLVLAQALLLNYLVNHFNLLGRPTFLPSLMYVTLTALFAPFMVLSAPLICNFLLIWMLFKLFSLYKSDDAKSTAYDLGMIVAIGSTFIYLPFIFLFLSIWIALVVFKPFNWREWVSGILGYLTIFFFFAVFYYLNNKLGGFYHIWAPLGSKFPNRININYYNYLVLIPVLLILVLYFFKLQQNFTKVMYRYANRSSFYFHFLIGSLSFYVKREFNLNHFLLCAVPAAVFFSYYFVNANIKWMYESLYLLLLISIIYFQFNTF
jgi:hypothetical protein